MAKLYGRWGAYEPRTPEEKARARRQEQKRRQEKALLAGAIEQRRKQEAAEIGRAMAAWNAMTEQERAAALKAAGSARPVDAMRHLGWDIPADMPQN